MQPRALTFLSSPLLSEASSWLYLTGEMLKFDLETKLVYVDVRI